MMEALRLHELAQTVSSLSPEKPFVEQEIRMTSPSQRWLRVSAAVVLDSSGQRRGTVLVFHDLTRVKYLENARKDFVANVSHELRTPLSLIKGYVETLVDGAYEDPKLCFKFLKTIQRNTDRLRLLIEDLLVLSEIESGRVSLDLQPIQLCAVVQKMLEDFSAVASARSMTLHNECPDVKLRADSGRLEQVLSNLLDNAVKYGREGGSISVGATPCRAGLVEVFVRDDGPGIPREALDRVFERFYRVDKARSRDQGGTGLGLSIVKHLVQSHGGRVWVESEVGKGAAFRFTLPAAPELPVVDNKRAGPR
jgi:two-component system phosphate regulon sensor histidine kinase PhoR